MYSYVFAYYLKDNTANKAIFQLNQGYLEAKVERLSAVFKLKVHKLNNDYFRELKSTMEFCDNHSKQLVYYVKEHKAKNTWQYTNI